MTTVPEIRYLTRQEYFEWAQSMTTGDVLVMYLSAVELGKQQEIPDQTLAYDEENNIIYVAREENGH